jgi:hypothetical protein
MVLMPDVIVGAEPQPLLSAAWVTCERAARPKRKELMRCIFVKLCKRDGKVQLFSHCRMARLSKKTSKAECHEYIYPLVQCNG